MNTLSQSQIKALENPSLCPAKYNACFNNGMETESTIYMLRGQYFEYHCLGNKTTKGQLVDDLPRRKKDGMKMVDQERIDEQIGYFKNEFLKNYKIEIKTCALNLEIPYTTNEEKRVTLRGVTDMTGTIDGKPIIADLKLTSNIYNQYGDFCWGSPWNMDHLQPSMYLFIAQNSASVHDLNISDLGFYYFVFDYKAGGPEHLIIEVKQTPDRVLELKERIRVAVNKDQELYRMGYPTAPTFNECKNCPLKNTCKDSTKIKPIISI